PAPLGMIKIRFHSEKQLAADPVVAVVLGDGTRRAAFKDMDFDNNNQISNPDLNILFNAMKTCENIKPEYDLNSDGLVNVNDLTIFQRMSGLVGGIDESELKSCPVEKSSDYVYSFVVKPEYQKGPARVVISGDLDTCPGTSVKAFEVLDPCKDVKCDAPWQPKCTDDEGSMIVYSLPGTCYAGKCSYPKNVQNCPEGCDRITGRCRSITPGEAGRCTGADLTKEQLCTATNQNVASDTPRTLVQSCAGATGICLYECKTGFHPENTDADSEFDSCVQDGTQLADCAGALPANSQWNDGAQTDGKFTQRQVSGVWTPESKNAEYSTAEGECKYKCILTAHRTGNECILNACSSPAPDNSTLCEGDGAEVSENGLSGVVVDSCSGERKCQYTCRAGYYKSGNSCLSNPVYRCVQGERGALCTDGASKDSPPVRSVVDSGKSCTYLETCNTNTCRYEGTSCNPNLLGITISPASPTTLDEVNINAPHDITMKNFRIKIDTKAEDSFNGLLYTIRRGDLDARAHVIVVTAEDDSGNKYRAERSFTVGEPQQLYISSRKVPQALIVRQRIDAEVTVKNPLQGTNDGRYAMVECRFVRPDPAVMLNYTSRCIFIGPKQEQKFTFQTLADATGMWRFSECILNASTRTDCIADGIVYTFPDTITVNDRTELTINSISVPVKTVTIGNNATVVVNVSNLGIGKSAKVKCTVTKPTSGQDYLSSGCTSLNPGDSKRFSLEFKPLIVGTWLVSSCSVEGSTNENCTRGVQEDALGSTEQIVVEGEGVIFTPLSVSVMHSPTDSVLGQDTTVTAMSASSNLRQLRVVIGENIYDCNSPASPCIVKKSYPLGDQRYYAIAYNTFGEQARDPPNGTKTFTVRIGPNVTAPTGCFANISYPSCTFNKRTNRYEVRAEFSWRNGDRSKTVIDGNEKIHFISPFAYAESLPTPGAKSIVLKVQNVNGTDLCTKSSQVTCEPAVLREDLVIRRIMPEVSKPGFVTVELKIIPGKDINNFTMKEHV
ncbi:MAG: hypothetical protein QMD85_02675, partial [Candidatus Aenigmarchaeota archaeon]|nr:hypothetical protein [Candidatus Aenigmarchaeota archaeon]